jgi:hypothetical protein
MVCLFTAAVLNLMGTTAAYNNSVEAPSSGVNVSRFLDDLREYLIYYYCSFVNGYNLHDVRSIHILKELNFSKAVNNMGIIASTDRKNVI